MKRVLLLVCLGLLCLTAKSQTLHTQVIGSTGHQVGNGQLQLSWTVGEPIVTTLEGSITLSQGFHQPYYRVTTDLPVRVDEPRHGVAVVRAYPNPTRRFLELSSVEVPLRFIRVISAAGQVLLDIEADQLQWQIDLAQFPQASYFILVEDVEGNRQQFTIQKQ